jgi:hypothetical protein
MPIILGPWLSILARSFRSLQKARKTHSSDPLLPEVIIGDGDVIATMLLASEPYDIQGWVGMLTEVHENLKCLMRDYPSDDDIMSAWKDVDRVLRETNEAIK